MDAFTSEFVEGNSAAVIPIGTWLPDRTIKAIQ